MLFGKSIKLWVWSGRVFDDEYDLILAIIQGVYHRGRQGDFSVKRLMLN